MIARQPNGRYCRISTIVDAPTHQNWTEEELKAWLVKTNQLGGKPVKEWMATYGMSFRDALDLVRLDNVTQEEMNEWITKVSKEVAGDVNDQ